MKGKKLTTPTIVAGSTKHLLLNQWARRQNTSYSAAAEASVLDTDYSRRTRELVAAGCLEWTGKLNEGRKVFRITDSGRVANRGMNKSLR